MLIVIVVGMGIKIGILVINSSKFLRIDIVIFLPDKEIILFIKSKKDPKRRFLIAYIKNSYKKWKRK